MSTVTPEADYGAVTAAPNTVRIQRLLPGPMERVWAYLTDSELRRQWLAAGEHSRDPVWRMPLWRPYLRYLTSQVADLANAGSRMAGAVTAALYLERFVPDGMKWAHLDVYAWNDSDRAGRPAGGEALALRSAYAMLKARYGA